MFHLTADYHTYACAFVSGANFVFATAGSISLAEVTVSSKLTTLYLEMFVCLFSI